MSLRSVFSLFSSDLAIDLGTANTCVYARGKGIVVNEPSIVAINKLNGRVEAVGRDAKEMLGRTPGNIVAIKPMKDGVIADFEVTEKMLTYFIKKAHNRNVWVRPRIVIGVPSEITQVEKRAVKDSAYRAKASEVHLVEEAMAAAIGAGMPITEPSGNMIVDIGGGTTDIAVISLAGIVYSKAVRVAGNEMDEAIIQYIRKTYNLLIGERTAEQIKIEIGSAYPLEERMTMEIKGRHLIEGVPKTITITDEEIREALTETVNVIVDAVRVALERTPPELVGRHRRPRHRADGRRVDAEESRQASEGRNRPAARDGGGSAVVRRAGRRQDALGLQSVAEDFNRLGPLAGNARHRFPPAHGSAFHRRGAGAHHPHFGAGQLERRRAAARGRHVRRVRRGAARGRRHLPAVFATRGTDTGISAHVRAENEQLRRQLGELQVQFQQERARAARASQLEKLLGFQQELRVETIAAGVIGASASLEFRGVTIDRGTTTARDREHGRDCSDGPRRTRRDADGERVEGAAV